METKKFQFEIDIKALSGEGAFSGYASVFNLIDAHKDIVKKGAFANTLHDSKLGSEIKLLWQHKQDEPIGYFTKIIEDEIGLYVEGKILLQLERGKEAYALLKSGAIEGLSIGYAVKDYEIDDSGIRIINQLDLYEISLVTFPANPEAGIISVKGNHLFEENLDELINLDRAIDYAFITLKN
jgi:HK97 family phage prohead protease